MRTTSKPSGAWGRPRPSDCTTSACARWGSWPPLPPDTLVRRLGKASGAHLSALARGDDPEPVRPNRPTKSIGHEETFSQDLVDPAELERHVLRMAESVATMLRGESNSCRTVTVKVKFRDFSLQTRSHTLDRPITTGSAIGQVAAALLAGIDPGEGIRLLGVSASGLQEGGADQLAFDLGDGMDQATDSAVAREQSWQDVTATVDAIRTRFGKSSVGSAAHVTSDGVVVPARRDAAVGARRIAVRSAGRVPAPGPRLPTHVGTVNSSVGAVLERGRLSATAGDAGSVEGPPSTALGCQEPTELEPGKVCRRGWDIGPFELPGQCLARPLRELCVDVTDHLPVVAEELGGAVDDVAEEHRSLGPGRNDDHGAARGVTGSAAHIHAGKNPPVAAPHFEAVGDRREQLRRCSATHQ